jgi:hypothetical protein
LPLDYPARLLKASSNDSGHVDIHSGQTAFSYRLHPGITIDCFPFSLSTSSRNLYRLHPGTLIALPRITHPKKIMLLILKDLIGFVWQNCIFSFVFVLSSPSSGHRDSKERKLGGPSNDQCVHKKAAVFQISKSYCAERRTPCGEDAKRLHSRVIRSNLVIALSVVSIACGVSL